MTLAETAPDAHRQQLLVRIAQDLEGYAAKGHDFSMKNISKEVESYSAELLEHVVSILEGDEYYDGVELINDIRYGWSQDRMLTTVKLHQKLNEMNHYPNAHVGFRQCRFHLEALLSYGSDVDIPRLHFGGSAVHPKHLALLIVTDALHVLCETDLNFNIDDDEPYDYMGGDVYRLTDEALINHLLSNPESGERTARVILKVATLRFEKIQPVLALMSQYPEHEPRILELLDGGVTRTAQIEAVITGASLESIAEGVL